MLKSMPIEWSCSLLQDIAILPLCFWSWPPCDSQCLENFTWCDSIFPHHGSLVCFLFVNILSELFTGTQSLHFQGLGTPRPWTSHWTCCRSEMCKGHVHFILHQCKITNSERLHHREPHHHCRWAEAELPIGGKKSPEENQDGVWIKYATQVIVKFAELQFEIIVCCRCFC